MFLCESGADKRKVFPLTSGTLVCGRSEEADISVQDPFVSGRHFTVTEKKGSWFVEDLGSSNGLEINDAKVHAARLEDGDLLRVGSTYLRFHAHDESAAEAAQEGLPVIEGYQIIERIGVGGMGEVYRARQCSLDREVALKTLSPAHAQDREFVSRFFREARAAGNLNHPNIVQVHDVGECDGVCYMCMEFVGGGDLTSRLRDDGKLPADEVIRIITEVARGLEFAESRQIVHCDIKPDNIMFTESGMPKIADLGIARSASGYQERKKEVFGSPHYMAPEQAMGKPVDCRADLYSLGCTMFRMLSGRTPFSGASARDVMKKQVTDEHPDLLLLAPDCPPELADIVDFLMEKKPDERCPSATELLRLLAKFKTHGTRSHSARISARVARASGRTRISSRGKEELKAPKPSLTERLRGLPLGAKAAVGVALLVVLLALGKFLFFVPPDPARLFETVNQKQKKGDFVGAIQLLKEFPAGEDQALLERIRSQIIQLQKAQSKVAKQMQFQRLWNEYLTIRSNSAKTVLEKKLEYMASLLDENYPDELRTIHVERVRVMGLKQ